jgi:chromosome segregation ATPase
LTSAGSEVEFGVCEREIEVVIEIEIVEELYQSWSEFKLEALREMDVEMDDVPQSFRSTQDELHFWKQRAQHFQRRYEEQRDQFDEYEEYSKNVEQELDMELKQYQAKNAEMKSHMSRVLQENETLRSRLEQSNAEYNAQLSELSSEVASFRRTSDEVNQYVRVLEQKNDDLERANRALGVSIEDFEQKLNCAIERNAFLESELDEKESLKAIVQRLKEETKDLQGELAVKRLPVFQPVDNKDMYRTQIDTRGTHNPLTIVNDLLRKVGVLESKLATYNRDHSLKRKLHNDFIK